jgi:hypothetical protein
MARVVTEALLVLAVAVVQVAIIHQAQVLLALALVALPRVAHVQVEQQLLIRVQAVAVQEIMTLVALEVQVFALLSIGVRTWHTLQKSLTESLLT